VTTREKFGPFAILDGFQEEDGFSEVTTVEIRGGRKALLHRLKEEHLQSEDLVKALKKDLVRVVGVRHRTITPVLHTDLKMFIVHGLNLDLNLIPWCREFYRVMK